jgi:hypothetical protein
VLSSARTFSDDVQSGGDRVRIGEDRSESVMSLILILVNPRSRKFTKKWEQRFFLVVARSSGLLNFRGIPLSGGLCLSSIMHTHKSVCLNRLLLLGRGVEKGPNIVLLPGVNDLWLDHFDLFRRRCSGLGNSHCF